jgi:hypothetical protein
VKDNELKLAEVQAPHTLGNTKSSTTSRLVISSAESMTYSMLYVVESLCTTDTLCLLWSSFDIKSYEVILRWVKVALQSSLMTLLRALLARMLTYADVC